MEIKFNLKQAQVYIHFGRLMNLKENFKLNDVQYSDKEIDIVAEELKNSNFDIKTQSFAGEVENDVKNFLRQHKTSIIQSLGQMTKDTVLQDFSYKESCHNVSESLKEEISDIAKGIEEDPRVKKLKEKLATLKSINNKI